jgi:hypothetical protein
MNKKYKEWYIYMFSSWFNHAVKATLAARIWQVQEYDDARILCLFSWALTTNQSKQVSALLRQPESQ